MGAEFRQGTWRSSPQRDRGEKRSDVEGSDFLRTGEMGTGLEMCSVGALIFSGLSSEPARGEPWLSEGLPDRISL